MILNGRERVKTLVRGYEFAFIFDAEDIRKFLCIVRFVEIVVVKADGKRFVRHQRCRNVT